MNEMRWIVWVFPLLFIIHDMEEIITAKKWCAKGCAPRFKIPIKPFGNTRNTSGFAIGVYEELIIECLAALIGVLGNFYGIWYGLLVCNIVHLVLFHIILLPICYGRYVPGEITAWITLLPCVYILMVATDIIGYSGVWIAIWGVVGIVVGFVNLKLMHRNLHRLEKLTN